MAGMGHPEQGRTGHFFITIGVLCSGLRSVRLPSGGWGWRSRHTFYFLGDRKGVQLLHLRRNKILSGKISNFRQAKQVHESMIVFCAVPSK